METHAHTHTHCKYAEFLLGGTGVEIVMMLLCDGGCREDWVCRYSLILFHQCVFPTRKVSWKTQSIPLGGVWLWAKCTSSTRVSQGTVYHLRTLSRHAATHYSMSSLLFTQRYTVPFLSLPPILYHTLTHTHKSPRPLSGFEQYMQCPETELHAQLMSLLSRWLTLPDSHSQTLTKFHSPPASPSVLSSLLGLR